MLKVLPLMGCAWALVLNPEAHALPNPQLEELPEIEEVLQRAGWTMTPEMSAAYTQPGNIFDENNALLKRGRDCFEVKVGPPAAYASMEVNRSLEAGVRMRVLVAGVRAGLGIEKKLVFDTPKHRQIPRLDLRLNAACRGVFDELVATGEDISGAYVVTESLSAVVQKQECGSFDVKAGVFVVSGDAKIQQSCSQTSLEPVAVAYKRVPLLTVLKRANAASVVTATAPQTPGREHIARASVETQFDAVEEPTDIQSRLRKQRCDEEAKRNSVKVREARIDRAVAEAQTQAADALQRIESDLQACTQLKRGDRGRCIETLNSWLSKAENLKVSIPAGVERVDTACGQQEAVFESAERTVASSEVGRAQGLLKRLMVADATGCGEPGSTLELMGKISMSQVDQAFRSNSSVAQCLTEWTRRRGLGRWQLLMNVRLTVGNDGSVVCVQSLSEGQTLIDASLKTCVEDAAYRMRIDVSGGPVTVQYALKAMGQ